MARNEFEGLAPISLARCSNVCSSLELVTDRIDFQSIIEDRSLMPLTLDSSLNCIKTK